LRAIFALGTVLLNPVRLVAAQAPSALSPDVRAYVSVAAPMVALTHVRVVDGTGAPPLEDQTVLIANGRIQGVGAAAGIRLAAGVQILDLTGHTVIPGLIGLHDHTLYLTQNRVIQASYTAPRLYLGSGVTTIRTLGSIAPYNEVNMKRSIERGEAPGPRMHIAGPHITGGEAQVFVGPKVAVDMQQVETREAARRVVADWAEEGADWIKAYTSISRANLGAAIEEAHKRGIKVTGHLCSVTAREAVALGIDNLEHGLLANTDFHPNKVPDVCPSDRTAGMLDLDMAGPAVQTTFREMVAKHVAMTSTLATQELRIPNRPPLDQRILDAMAPETREEFLAQRVEHATNVGSDSTPARLFRKVEEYQLAFVKAGGLLAAGVDAGSGNLHGFGDQRQFELLVETGFTPVQAVQIMTANGAKVLGVFDQLGSVTPGKLADLVVIRGNPVANPADIRKVITVFKDGVGYDAAKLIESVRGQVGLH